jgi:hypothetical protein
MGTDHKDRPRYATQLLMNKFFQMVNGDTSGFDCLTSSNYQELKSNEKNPQDQNMEALTARSMLLVIA